MLKDVEERERIECLEEWCGVESGGGKDMGEAESSTESINYVSHCAPALSARYVTHSTRSLSSLPHTVYNVLSAD